MTVDAPLHVVIASRAIAPQHGFGGLERATAHHLRALARRGVRLTLFTQRPDPHQPPPETFGGLVTWRIVPYHRQLPLRPNSIPDRLLHYARFSRTVGRAIAALCRHDRVDIVHAHGLAALGYAEELRAEGGGQKAESSVMLPALLPSALRPLPSALPPLVLNPHGLEEFSGRNRSKWLAYAPFRHGLRHAARVAAAIIATDQSLVGPIERQLWVAPERIVTIPNGVDIAELDALVRPALIRELRDRYRLADSPLTLVSVARLERNKGLHDGLAALSLLRDRLPSGWRWLMVGQGSEKAALRAAIDQQSLATNVTLTGPLPDEEVHSLLEAADLFLVPSLYEGSSLAALEAMTHRLPIVATTVGGLPDKVIPGRTGFLAPPGDPAALAAALTAALAARPTWPTLGAQARALVAAEFSWSALADQYLALYRRLAGDAAP